MLVGVCLSVATLEQEFKKFIEPFVDDIFQV